MGVELQIESDEMLIDACRVEEMQPKFIETQTQTLKQSLNKRFPTPHFTTLQKQIYCQLKN